MRNRYVIDMDVMLSEALLAKVYFATVFNESVRHVLDVPAMLFVAPCLLLDHC